MSIVLDSSKGLKMKSCIMKLNVVHDSLEISIPVVVSLVVGKSRSSVSLQQVVIVYLSCFM